jgi:hypothetical protein
MTADKGPGHYKDDLPAMPQPYRDSSACQHGSAIIGRPGAGEIQNRVSVIAIAAKPLGHRKGSHIEGGARFLKC